MIILWAVSQAEAVEIRRVRHLMGTICEIRIPDKNRSRANEAASAAFNEIARLEQILSTWKKDSEVSKLNRTPPGIPVPVSPELFELTRLSVEYSRLTDGAFDATVSSAGYQHLNLDASSQTIAFGRSGMALDFGGIGKGFALDKAAEVLRAQGVQSAFFNFGGQVLAVGRPEHKKSWKAQVLAPDGRGNALIRLSLENISAATSSQWEKPGHILSPKTGNPVNFKGSVTVTAPSAVEADALSTALFVIGPENGLVWIKTRPKTAAFFIIPNNAGWKVLSSSGTKNKEN